MYSRLNINFIPKKNLNNSIFWGKTFLGWARAFPIKAGFLGLTRRLNRYNYDDLFSSPLYVHDILGFNWLGIIYDLNRTHDLSWRRHILPLHVCKYSSTSVQHRTRLVINQAIEQTKQNNSSVGMEASCPPVFDVGLVRTPRRFFFNTVQTKHDHYKNPNKNKSILLTR